MTVAMWVIAIWIVTSIAFVGGGVWWENRHAVKRDPHFPFGYTVGAPQIDQREDETR